MKIEEVVYKLILPKGNTIHHVVLVPLLKKKAGTRFTPLNMSIKRKKVEEEPLVVLQKYYITGGNKDRLKWLV